MGVAGIEKSSIFRLDFPSTHISSSSVFIHSLDDINVIRDAIAVTVNSSLPRNVGFLTQRIR